MRAVSPFPSLCLHSELHSDWGAVTAAVLASAPRSFLGFNAICSHLLGGAMERTFGVNLGLNLCSAIYSHLMSIYHAPGTVLCALNVLPNYSLKGGA